MKDKCKCRLCGNDEAEISQSNEVRLFTSCPICGNYILSTSSSLLLDKQFAGTNVKCYDKAKLIAYLYHNKQDNRYAFVGTEDAYKQYKIHNPQTVSYIVAPETVENWYPTTFEERINYILLLWAKKTKFVGESLHIGIEELTPFFFLVNAQNTQEWRQEVRFIIRYLSNEGLIEYPITNDIMNTYMTGLETNKYTNLTLSAKAWGIVYDLQRSKVNNKSAFVAMKFGEQTIDLRAKIKEGIESAGYVARIMDEIEHNHQIVPEMLSEIRNSRFVVAELSHHNNGAYYEAGYAYGLGKEVIHICNEEALKNDLHFDVSQVNTIVYKDISELPERLKKRIQATIL